ncbi:CpaF family protein [Bacillus firmus]|uniref:ATPase, T2SS/T4P/T4SS family n=1 Tax=Cytobacillus firmus TaxID=1399 RepID=UPI001580A983|nr:ATPase, T2SS/T4P/T4SS family [Cytobacillus firmus]NUH84757.1 CpaF family protein [Cytobacillus firmus]
MKNTIDYKGLITTETNVINLEKLLYQKEKDRQIKPKIKFSNQLQQITDYIKNYLNQEQYRELIRDSFGNKRKQEQLKGIIHSHVSSKAFLSTYSKQITDYTLDEVTEYLVEKIAGLDVLQPLSEIPTVTDINCIAWNNIWVDDIYKGEYKTDITFESEQDYIELCNRFAYASGKSYSTARPSVNAVFPYMRVNIVGQDLSPKTSLSIRIVSKELRLSEQYMLDTGYANREMIEFLKLSFATESHLICGGTGTGKTELLRYFTRYTKDNASIIMIEDTPETYLDELYPDKPIKMWQNREASDDDKKQFGYSYHVRNAMRQLPKYIYIQESRGEESLDILEASETDHIVSTTLHAKSAIDCVTRFIVLCQKAHQHPSEFYGKRITNSFKIGIHIKRFGKVRKINQIVEYVGFQNDEVKANVLFEYDSQAQRHVQKDRISQDLWDSLYETHHDLTGIENLDPSPQKSFAMRGV